MRSLIDNKYIVKHDKLNAVTPELSEHFDILQIEGISAFTYDTRYFDDLQRNAYHEHHQGIRKGFKVRVRRYSDAGLCFLEVKVKGRRGATEKFRQAYDPEMLEGLTPDARAFAEATYSQQYDKPFNYQLLPSLDIRYRRITLVARAGGERVTIDTDLKFMTDSGTLATGTDVFIIETKSGNGRGVADLILRTAGERPTKRCSKYCVGMAAMGEVGKYNSFLPTMRKLGLINSEPAIGRWSEIRADLFGKVQVSSSPEAMAAA